MRRNRRDCRATPAILASCDDCHGSARAGQDVRRDPSGRRRRPHGAVRRAGGAARPNGAGKTTTLLMLLGAVTPDAGSIEIEGHRLPGGRSRAMEHVGFAAGYLPLPDRLRVKEALGLFAGFYGLSGPEADEAVTVGLERFRVPTSPIACAWICPLDNAR
ncbi:MAG: ATP-binding cassette domain-containing protein [Acidimicrobiales bacterium]